MAEWDWLRNEKARGNARARVKREGEVKSRRQGMKEHLHARKHKG